MRRALVGAFWLLLAGVSVAQPVVSKILPEAGKAGSTVFITGSGFGTNPEGVRVFFGDTRGKVVLLRGESLAVNVPLEAARTCEVTVEVDGGRSNAVPFRCTPSVHLTVGDNPLQVGRTTTGVFRVYHEDRP